VALFAAPADSTVSFLASALPSSSPPPVEVKVVVVRAGGMLVLRAWALDAVLMGMCAVERAARLQGRESVLSRKGTRTLLRQFDSRIPRWHRGLKVGDTYYRQRRLDPVPTSAQMYLPSTILAWLTIRVSWVPLFSSITLVKKLLLSILFQKLLMK
jgi:hypothetical protein